MLLRELGAESKNRLPLLFPFEVLRARFLVDLQGVIFHRVQDGYDDEARSSLLASRT